MTLAALVECQLVRGSIEVVAAGDNRVDPSVAVNVGGHDRSRGFCDGRWESSDTCVSKVAPAVVEQQHVAILAFLALSAPGQNVEVAIVVEVRCGARAAVVEIGPAWDGHGAAIASFGYLIGHDRPPACALGGTAVERDELGIQVIVEVANEHLTDW